MRSSLSNPDPVPEASADLCRELLQLLEEHRRQPIDYVALFMFLNTIEGGYYQDRWDETQLRQALQQMHRRGHIEAISAESASGDAAESAGEGAAGRTPESAAAEEVLSSFAPGEQYCLIRLTDAGRTALWQG